MPSAKWQPSEKIRQREASGAHYRMPICFGPFPGPRQTWEGVSRLRTPAWTEATRCVLNIVFKTPKAFVETLMTHESFSVDVPGDEVYCTWSCRELGNLGWLGQQSYRTFGLYISDVVCQGDSETVRGDFYAVLYESMSDPATSGREELGTSKLFANLDYELHGGDYSMKAGWEDHMFCDVRATGLEEIDINSAKPKSAFEPSQGVLHYKYVPATGRPGFADVEYPCITPYSPPVATGKTTKLMLAKDAAFTWAPADWQTLPTMHHIVSALEKIKVLEMVDARISWVTGSGDLSNYRAVR